MSEPRTLDPLFAARAVVEVSAVVAIIFALLKLTGHIEWSWFWVLSPLWSTISAVIVVCVLLILWAEATYFLSGDSNAD